MYILFCISNFYILISNIGWMDNKGNFGNPSIAKRNSKTVKSLQNVETFFWVWLGHIPHTTHILNISLVAKHYRYQRNIFYFNYTCGVGRANEKIFLFGTHIVYVQIIITLIRKFIVILGITQILTYLSNLL